MSIGVNDIVRVVDRAAYKIGELGTVLAVYGGVATVLMTRPNTPDLAHRIPVEFLDVVVVGNSRN